MSERSIASNCAGLHVLMTADAVGGVFSYASSLAREICAAQGRVTLVLQGPAATAAKLDALARVPGLDVIVTDLALEWLDPDGRDFSRALRHLERIARGARPDVAHFNGFRETVADVGAARVLVAHSCVGSWWRACRNAPPDAAWERYEANLRAGLDAADAWAAPSHWYRDTMAELYAPLRAGQVIHNGCAPRAPGASDARIVFAAGRMWDEAKDLATIARASHAMRWPVAIAGPSQRDGEVAASDAGAATLLGELAPADLAQHLERAGIFVSTALYEPFGLAVLEAAASGCALVLADTPSFRELWGDAALYFAARDANELAHQANRLADDPALRRVMRARAIARAQRYTATRMGAETMALYACVLAPAASHTEVAA